MSRQEHEPASDGYAASGEPIPSWYHGTAEEFRAEIAALTKQIETSPNGPVFIVLDPVELGAELSRALAGTLREKGVTATLSVGVEDELRQMIREELRAVLAEARTQERLSSVQLETTIGKVKITAKEYAATCGEAHTGADAAIKAERRALWDREVGIAEKADGRADAD